MGLSLIEKKGSTSFQMSREDFQALGRGALIALAGAGIVFLSDTIGQYNFGQWTPFVAALAAIGVNFLRKFLANNK